MLTPGAMATYRMQRGRSSAAGDPGRGSSPDALPSMASAASSGRRQLLESVSVPRPSEEREVSSPAPSPKASEKREVPSLAPSERRELEDVATVAQEHAVPRREDGEEQLEEYSTDVNDMYVDDDSYGDGEAEGAKAEQKDRHEESAVDAKTSGLQKRRRLSYIIPSLDDRQEETADVYPGRTSGRFNYRNPCKR